MIQNGQLLAVFNSAHRVMKAESILKKLRLAIRYDSDIADNIFNSLASEKLLPTSIYQKKSDSHYELIWISDSIEESDV